jgi:hypothetical protein
MAGDNDSSRLLDSGGALVSRGLAHGQGLREVVKENKMKTAFGIVLMALGLFLAAWVAIYVMLYGGIMQATNNWGGDTSAVVWGIIQAAFFEFGVIPGGLVCLIGFLIVTR